MVFFPLFMSARHLDLTRRWICWISPHFLNYHCYIYILYNTGTGCMRTRFPFLAQICKRSAYHRHMYLSVNRTWHIFSIVLYITAFSYKTFRRRSGLIWFAPVMLLIIFMFTHILYNYKFRIRHHEYFLVLYV